MTEKLYTKAEVYAMALPSTYLQPLNLPLDTDVPALMKLYAKLKATQLTLPGTPVSDADDKEFYDLAIKKLFGEGATLADGQLLDEPSEPKPN